MQVQKVFFGTDRHTEEYGLRYDLAFERITREEFDEKMKTIKTCPRCKGDGHFHSTIGWLKENALVKCPQCNGKGKI
jgi:DnaJ-class molecular chaperone